MCIKKLFVVEFETDFGNNIICIDKKMQLAIYENKTSAEESLEWIYNDQKERNPSEFHILPSPRKKFRIAEYIRF